MTAEACVWITIGFVIATGLVVATGLAPVVDDVGRANGNACGRVSASSMVVKSMVFDFCALCITPFPP
jgi:hypothetical protein